MIDEIIKTGNFFHHFQPIYNIQEWDVYGYEGLLRTENKMNPKEFFEQVRIRKKLYEIDSRSIHKAFLTYLNAGFLIKDEKLFMNVHPSTLTNKQFTTFINSIINEENVKSQQIILELNESEQIENFEPVKNVIFELQRAGVSIALDDVGKNFSSMKSIIELEPDYVKLDQYFVKNLCKSKNKMYLIENLLSLCKKMDSKLIVEGVEDMVALALLKSLGVEYAQGYLLGMPKVLPQQPTYSLRGFGIN